MYLCILILQFTEPPPIWPDIRSELREYIECPERLSIHQLDNTQCYWPRKPDVLSLLEFDLAPVNTTLKFDRDPLTGKIGKIQEVYLQGAGETARNSMSMTRAPGSLADGVRGTLILPSHVFLLIKIVIYHSSDINHKIYIR